MGKRGFWGGFFGPGSRKFGINKGTLKAGGIRNVGRLIIAEYSFAFGAVDGECPGVNSNRGKNSLILMPAG